MFASVGMKGRHWDVLLGALFASMSAGGAVILLDSAFERGWGLGFSLFALGLVGSAAVITGNWIARRTALRRASDVVPADGRQAPGPERLLVVVRQDRRDLLDTLRTMFADQGNVKVIMERRRDLRRRRTVPRWMERRRAERRSRPEVQSAVAERGWSVVRLPPDPPQTPEA